MKRVVAIVIDSGGIGALADASEYGDAPGANTIGNVARHLGSLHLPNLERFGLGSLNEDRRGRAGRAASRAWSRVYANEAAAKIRSPATGR